MSIDTELLYETIKEKESISKFSNNTGITRATIYKWFNKTFIPNLLTVYKIIEELQLNNEQIMKIFFVRSVDNAA